MIYRARDRQLSYGRPIGIIVLEERIPCPPGTPGNPSTFAYPVCYEVARGVGTAALRQTVPAGLESFIAAGRRLVDRGAWAVAGNCGLMMVHQEALARALPVPVLLSSLLQVPLIARMLGPEAAIGIIVSGADSLDTEHLWLVCAGGNARIVLASMEGKPHFSSAVRGESGELDFEAVTAEAVEVARTLVDGHPDVRALLFECVDLPPYAHAVQEAVGLPVFDIVTLIDYFRSALARNRYTGVY
ncbi:MAG: aspartate/glutamate racemase family protein [Pseudomonadota bacterium]|nr:aspartate/glutamate racemase family protein [Pseudomonadota bacterium]